MPSDSPAAPYIVSNTPDATRALAEQLATLPFVEAFKLVKSCFESALDEWGAKVSHERPGHPDSHYYDVCTGQCDWCEEGLRDAWASTRELIEFAEHKDWEEVLASSAKLAEAAEEHQTDAAETYNRLFKALALAVPVIMEWDTIRAESQAERTTSHR